MTVPPSCAKRFPLSHSLFFLPAHCVFVLLVLLLDDDHFRSRDGAGESLGAAVAVTGWPSPTFVLRRILPFQTLQQRIMARGGLSLQPNVYGHDEGVSHVHCWLAIFTGENWWQPPFYS